MKNLYRGRWATKLTRIIDLMAFATSGKHPQKMEIISAFVAVNLRSFLCRMTRQPLRSFTLLGTKIHFTDPGAFRFLLGELFLDGGYSRCEQVPDTVLDCGSNIGMSILYFKSLWPNCRIKGVEASPHTFELLKKNVQSLSQVTVLNAAVGDRYDNIPFYPSSPNSLTGSSNAIRSGGEAVMVESIPMSSLIDGPIDLLKIDIEGSETVAFAELEASGKMHLIREMFIEFHYNLPAEGNNLTEFLDRLSRCGFEYELGSILPDRFGECHDMFIWAKRSGDSASPSHR